MRSPKAERNTAIVAAYAGGATLIELAALHGIHHSRVWRIVRRSGYRLSPDQRGVRNTRRVAA